MEFLNNALEGLKNAFSSMGSGISNFFSGLGNGGGLGSIFGGGATSSPVHTAPPMVGNPIPPPGATPGYVPQAQPSPGITHPQYQTNVFNPQSVQNQGLNILNDGARRIADRIGGLGGQVVATIAAGSIAVAGAGMQQDARIAAAQQREAMWRANSQGAISMAPPGQPMGQMPNARGQFGAASPPVPLSERLMQAKQDGAEAMMNRTLNQAQTQVWQKLIGPPSHPGGAFGKLFR